MEEQSETPRRAYPPQRSAASSNWRMKDSTPRAEASPQPQSQSQPRTSRNLNSPRPDENPGTRLYVGNLLYTATRADVETLFTSNGFSISGISMSVDPFTGRNPSYAFVDFETVDEANRAMEGLNGAELLGRGVRINPGVRKGQEAEGVQRGGKSFGEGRRPRDDRGECMSFIHFLYFRILPSGPTQLLHSAHEH